EEADAQGRLEMYPCRHLHNRVALRGRQPGSSIDKMVTKDQVRRLGRVVGRTDHGVEMELAQRRVNAIDPEVLVNGDRLVVGHAAERRLRIIRSRCQGDDQVPDVLVEIRQLDVLVGKVEGDGVLQLSARYWHAD